MTPCIPTGLCPFILGNLHNCSGSRREEEPWIPILAFSVLHNCTLLPGVARLPLLCHPSSALLTPQKLGSLGNCSLSICRTSSRSEIPRSTLKEKKGSLRSGAGVRRKGGVSVRSSSEDW